MVYVACRDLSRSRGYDHLLVWVTFFIFWVLSLRILSFFLCTLSVAFSLSFTCNADGPTALSWPSSFISVSVTFCKKPVPRCCSLEQKRSSRRWKWIAEKAIENGLAMGGWMAPPHFYFFTCVHVRQIKTDRLTVICC